MPFSPVPVNTSRAVPRSLAFEALAATVLLALAPGAVAQAPVDLGPIFAPPTPAEIQAVRIDWSSRSPAAIGVRIENAFDDPVTGYSFQIISHVVDGLRHYGAIRFPLDYVFGQKYPVLVVCHGSTNGVSVEEAANLVVHFPDLCVRDEHFLVIPSFRGEVLATQTLGNYQSEGTLSWADRDVDDTRAMLNAALDLQPDMDRARIGAWGISRGGAVALLLSVRDDRIRRVVDMFGFTDLSLPSLVGQVDAIVNQGVTATGLPLLVMNSVVTPYLQGALSLGQARVEWIKRSPAYFVSAMPPLQAHHGLQDVQVDAGHTQALLDALASFGVPPSEAQGYYYPTGQHGLNSMPGHGPIVEPFLCAISAGPVGYCGPMTPHGGGQIAGMDYQGSSSLQSANFRLRVHRSRANGAGLFFVAPSRGYFPSGAGFLCLGSGAQRVGLALVDGSGYAQLALNLAAIPPAASALIAPGSTAHFQFVFRDFGNPNGAWNLSNGLSVTFQP